MVTTEIQALIDQGALFVLNHSGGKDSQAMTIAVRKVVPDRQLLVIHADLPEVDWPNIAEHINATCERLPVIVTRASKTFFEMVEHRKMFPSPQQRQCTSDLKRGPIEREIRRYLAKHPEFKNQVVNCMGLRADESNGRKALPEFRKSQRNSVAGRAWYDWLPIHKLSTAQVFASIADAGQKPHWAYEAGMSRLSCCFCIMSNAQDLRTAARLKPELYAKYVQTERRLGVTMFMPRKVNGEVVKQTLEDLTRIQIN